MKHTNEWYQKENSDEREWIKHRPAFLEFQFYNAVAEGDVEAVEKNCNQEKLTEQDGVGVLSRNPVINIKYHFVITIAMLARLCHQKGMAMELAYNLSDFYIQKLDDIPTVQGVQMLHQEVVIDFAKRMSRINRRDTNSLYINQCKEYIFAHIRERITIKELAEALGVSAGYLSRLFKSETGDSASGYIRKKKIELAKNLLKYSDYSMIEIANILSFSSQSHFIQQFRESEGITPKKYREKNSFVEWEIEME